MSWSVVPLDLGSLLDRPKETITYQRGAGETVDLVCYGWLLVGDDGPLLVDTGPSSGEHARDFHRVRLEKGADQALDRALVAQDVDPSDVRTVVLSHLHTDHAGGLHHFPDNHILVSRTELDYAAGLRGRLRGYPNKRWPAWFSPATVDLPLAPLGPFPQSLPLTAAADVVLVPLPGHSPGQVGVLVTDGDHSVLIAADSSYTESAMLRGVVSGIGADEAAERLTLERIRSYAAQTPTVYLASHDPETAARLAERRTVGTAPEQVRV
jgi:glyoxylase-like metal-dependent hydrolase (beta-lactamase superfamily II)